MIFSFKGSLTLFDALSVDTKKQKQKNESWENYLSRMESEGDTTSYKKYVLKCHFDEVKQNFKINYFIPGYLTVLFLVDRVHDFEWTSPI